MLFPRFRLRLSPVTVFLLGLLAPCGSRAQQAPPKPQTILFVGNSFFHGRYNPVFSYNAAAITIERVGKQKIGDWGGIPAIFKKFADEAGLAYEVHLQCINGESLKLHFDSAQYTLRQPRWNTVVLQEHSMYPLPARRSGHPDTFRDYSTRIEQLVHQANPTARLYFYQTWARADQTYPAGKAYSGLPLDSMSQDLHRGYYGAARLNGRFTGVAPAGDAWLRAIQAGVALRNPYQPEAGKLNLWGEDHYHPSAAGAYLNACVLFGEITGYDPRRLGPQEQAAAALGLLPTDAVALQRVAAEQVLAARPAAFSTAGGQQKTGKGKTKVKTKAARQLP
ncbi:DUF4886 domain-containing protein [Hymenobacter chitinivorans]|uniref:Lysophospholipase L1-like esterase n=1 Tax=Hymenobacter chitinivorans DSM 11115 TaxID=1121954 RepID=A0A2M9BMV3_9BACT|nr:DUF4886 domain-containing protein [Hymenobacter chitinivorans]PJJ59281.1 hypothetical protein CLV45_0697 [Hymenobacter chitinivorans DSM 11115]